MPRPFCERTIRASISSRVFKPAGIPARELEDVFLAFDEAEAVRLSDLEGLYQEAAARSMGVSRQTFGRIIESARRKIADAILNGKALRVAGGEEIINRTGDTPMKIALPTRDGTIDAHFGHCKEFMIFEVSPDGSLGAGTIHPSPSGCGCKSSIASELAHSGVTHMVAGNMGDGAVRVLGANGIKVVRGASGDARAAAEQFAKGGLADSGQGCVEHKDHDCSHD